MQVQSPTSHMLQNQAMLRPLTVHRFLATSENDTHVGLQMELMFDCLLIQAECSRVWANFLSLLSLSFARISDCVSLCCFFAFVLLVLPTVLLPNDEALSLFVFQIPSHACNTVSPRSINLRLDTLFLVHAHPFSLLIFYSYNQCGHQIRTYLPR
ncbi:hypothetical protein VNO78_18396 [Psophocarpus tetragonolobus]|uniref:Uncharacterized protein n=1 Tax=Psophocarpus tetragonolobus TaxID=3891 RepID=A0AAN9XLZ6_PSOTE